MNLRTSFILSLLLALGATGCATNNNPKMARDIDQTWEAADLDKDDGRWHRVLNQDYIAKGRHDTSAGGYGIVTAGDKGHPKEEPAKAFDGAPAKYCSTGPTLWVQYRYGGGLQHEVTSYAVQSANDAPERDPKDWKLLGSNDGETWTTLDEQSGISFPRRNFTWVYDVAQPGPYKLYRLEVTANHGANKVQLADLDFLVAKDKNAPVMSKELEDLLAAREEGLEPLFAADFSNAVVKAGSWVFEKEQKEDAEEEDSKEEKAEKEDGGEDGDEVLVPKGGGDIWTKDSYGDFVLDLEFKCVKDTNSGVLLRCSDLKQWVQNTIEVQILQPTSKNKKHECGGIFDCLKPRKRAVKEVGEWNHYTIVAKGPDIHVILNGEYVSHMNVDLWTEANVNPDGTRNKFKTAYRDMAREGQLGLQYHGQQIQFRNVRVKRLE